MGGKLWQQPGSARGHVRSKTFSNSSRRATETLSDVVARCKVDLDTYLSACVYHLPGIELLLKVIPVENILFASEMVGAVKSIDPETGHYFDDTKRYIDAISWLGDKDRMKIFEGNARKVYSRIR